jgi:hypothetical protein
VFHAHLGRQPAHRFVRPIRQVIHRVDQYEIALLDFNRGTNDVKAIQKQLVVLCGTLKTGVQMCDAPHLSERRHR